MAAYLLDTNLLLRFVDPASPQHPVAVQAVATLVGGNHPIYITAQNLVEFWAVVTRPQSANGFGWDPAKAAAEVRSLQAQFPLLADDPRILGHWFRLVETYGVRGKPTHDARLVAVMIAHGIPNLLTFNGPDFKVFRELTVVRPEDAVPAGPPPSP